MVRVQYQPDVQAEVCATLLEYGESRWQSQIDRVLFDALYLAEGDCARLRQLIDLASKDPRDLMSQEYFRRAGHLYPHSWARRHDPNRDLPQAPPIGPAVIAVALFQVRPERKVGGSVRRPRSLFLSFNCRENLADFADRVLTLAEHENRLDLSPLLEYRASAALPTVAQRLLGEEPEALTYENGILSWNGNSGYWRACARQLAELATSEVPAHLSMMCDSEEQRVLAGFRPSGAEPRDPRRWY